MRKIPQICSCHYELLLRGHFLVLLCSISNVLCLSKDKITVNLILGKLAFYLIHNLAICLSIEGARLLSEEGVGCFIEEARGNKDWPGYFPYLLR